MKRILTLILSFCCLLSFVSCEKKEIADTFEANIWKLHGDYRLTDIHWPGLAVDLNHDGIGHWALLYEFQNKIGYYEPDYTASVSDGMVFSHDETWARPATAFNLTIPCPRYIVSEGKWVCSGIRGIQVTLRADVDSFSLQSNCSRIFPAYNDRDDVFLANIKDISLVVLSYDAASFRIGVHCTLPYDRPDGTQELNENYLYYEYSR